MAAGATYDKLASTTLSSNNSTVTFTSIPSTYTDLVIIFNGKAANNTDAQVRIGTANTPDSSAGYSRQFMFGYSGGIVADTASSLNGFIFSPYNQNTNLVMHLHSYANTNIYKPALIRNGPKPTSGDNLTYVSANIYRDTVAINCVQFYSPTHNFVTGSIFSIYGIKAA
jgi:hypothetical protein